MVAGRRGWYSLYRVSETISLTRAFTHRRNISREERIYCPSIQPIALFQTCSFCGKVLTFLITQVFVFVVLLFCQCPTSSWVTAGLRRVEPTIDCKILQQRLQMFMCVKKRPSLSALNHQRQFEEGMSTQKSRWKVLKRVSWLLYQNFPVIFFTEMGKAAVL